MRLGVIDVGSNTVHLLVVDAHEGAHPTPASSHKQELRLSEHVLPDGRIGPEGVERLTRFVGECLQIAEDNGVEEMLAFATSAIREAPNGDEVLRHVEEQTGVRLKVLSGSSESRLTFLAVRRWFGWSAGRVLMIDIGGGSLELAAGIDEDPDVAISLPLGAGRMTLDLPGDPPDAQVIRDVRRRVRSQIAKVVRDVSKVGAPDQAVGTSKTIRSLARICGAAPRAEGPYVERTLALDDLRELVGRLGSMTIAERTGLPGVSSSRAPQLLAGAIAVEAAMDLLGVDRLTLCPWALREGIILRRLDSL